MRAMTMIPAMAIVLAASPLHAQSTSPQSATLDGIAPQIEAGFTTFMAENHVPGLVYGVVQGGHLALVKGEGVQDIAARRPVTPDSLFRIASMTKAFTALSILSLRDKGLLSLDDPAEKYVPEMRGWTYPTSDSPKIRVRDLLQHVAGFVTDDPWGDRQQVLSQEDFTALLKTGVPFTREPQARHEYSNLGYAILGRIVANVTGQPYRRYVEKTFLVPLGMASSGYDTPASPIERRAVGYRWENGAWSEEPTMKDGAFNSMGGLQVSANDYAKWIAFLLSGWPARDGPETGPVRRATIRELAQGLNFVSVATRPGSTGATACPLALAYGMGWRVMQDCDLGLTMSHGGGYPGYGSHVMLMPEYGTGIFVLTNRTYAGPTGPAWDAAMLMHKAGLLHRPAMPVSPDLASFYAAAQAVWQAGTVAPLNGRVAMNFPMDRTAENWANVLGDLKAQAGACDTAAPITPTGRMTGTFRWTCGKGSVNGQIILAPTRPITIQALRFTFEGAVP